MAHDVAAGAAAGVRVIEMGQLITNRNSNRTKRQRIRLSGVDATGLAGRRSGWAS
jgi:hypothetical protein